MDDRPVRLASARAAGQILVWHVPVALAVVPAAAAHASRLSWQRIVGGPGAHVAAEPRDDRGVMVDGGESGRGMDQVQARQVGSPPHGGATFGSATGRQRAGTWRVWDAPQQRRVHSAVLSGCAPALAARRAGRRIPQLPYREDDAHGRHRVGCGTDRHRVLHGCGPGPGEDADTDHAGEEPERARQEGTSAQDGRNAPRRSASAARRPRQPSRRP